MNNIALLEQITSSSPENLDDLLEDLDYEQLVDVVHSLVARLATPRFTSDPDSICCTAVQLAAEAFGVSIEDITSKRRDRVITDARAVAQVVARNFGLTLQTIGAYFHNNHATVIYSLEKVMTRPQLQRVAAELTAAMNAGISSHPAALAS